MKKYIIYVSTHWCGMNESYRAVAEEECELDEIAEELAYENFISYGGDSLMAEENGYDPEFMKEEDWDNLYEDVNETDYYNYNIKPFKGTDEEWEEEGGEIYGQ